MPVESYYVSTAERGSRVHDLFGDIASRYDLINDLQSLFLHRYWKRRVISLARIEPEDRVLDLCTGTGDLAQRALQKSRHVVAIDFSIPMLRVAQKRPIPGPLVQADAHRIPCHSEMFDVLTVGYGMRNLADPARGVSEMFRVLKPGGRLLILDFGKPEWNPWRKIYFGYLQWMVPLFGRLFCRNAAAYAYILESLSHYPAQHGVDRWLRQAGFCRLRIHRFLGGVMTINYGEKPV